MNSLKIIIAIDGYSSCGKSTMAKALASRLSYGYVDTGAMYRAVTLFFLQKNVFHSDNGLKFLNHEFLEEVMDNIEIHFHFNPKLGYGEIYLNGKNVEDEIRQMMVSDYVSQVSALKEVRKNMVALQKKMGINKGIVMDGRDIGTTVFPEAELKLFMLADPAVRAKRRYDELMSKGVSVSYEEVKSNLEKRDYEDTHRLESPLIKSDNAIILDNTNLNQEQQLEFAYSLAQNKINSLINQNSNNIEQNENNLASSNFELIKEHQNKEETIEEKK